ncbi:DUF1513 domain-containing protein [Sphaerotilus hippei]|uniref:DUF1513 domain-containing protein n=1 Tax=Sphaerotilus hippei TaxID=744406 RepID=UPI001474C25F|nr:DUF1513 domain-containing protein [Sphaerotilus hippei]
MLSDLVSPRADTLALFGPQETWRGALPHVEAYALAGNGGPWWAASSRGAAGVLHHTAGTAAVVHGPRAPALQIDNHWVLRQG